MSMGLNIGLVKREVESLENSALTSKKEESLGVFGLWMD